MWASKFKTKEERKLEALEKEINEATAAVEMQRQAIKEGEEEILAGAPDRDYHGVKDLKAGIIYAHKDIKRLEKKISRLNEKLRQGLK